MAGVQAHVATDQRKAVAGHYIRRATPPSIHDQGRATQDTQCSKK
jgi:hypothetical protein